MTRLFCLLIFATQFVCAQKAIIKVTGNEKAIITALRSHIGFLADDKLEGRRTGSAGEKAAYEYISKETDM